MIIGNKDEDNEVALKSLHQRENILRQNEIFNNPQTFERSPLPAEYRTVFIKFNLNGA